MILCRPWRCFESEVGGSDELPLSIVYQLLEDYRKHFIRRMQIWTYLTCNINGGIFNGGKKYGGILKNPPHFYRHIKYRHNNYRKYKKTSRKPARVA